MYGFPRRDWEIERTPIVPTELFGSSDEGTTSSTAYHSWTTRVQFNQDFWLAGALIKIAAPNSYALYLLDDSEVTLRRSPLLGKETPITTSESMWFPFDRIRVFSGQYCRFQMRIQDSTAAARIRYSSSFYSGVLHTEIQSWLSGSNNNAHMVMRIGVSHPRGRRRVETRYY